MNDSLGHHAGDTLLTDIAERLRGCTRSMDLVARLGGDEFLILLADLTEDRADATIRAVAARVNEAMRAPFDLQSVEFHARGSMGISVYPRDAHDPVELLKNADIAMYRAKRLEPGGTCSSRPTRTTRWSDSRSRRGSARRSRPRTGCSTTSPWWTWPTGGSSAPKR